MKNETNREMQQPAPVTPGITRAMVRQHAYRLYRDKLDHSALTLEDWVLAEKDLVQTRMAEGVEA
jgi:hypothetical protein